MDTSIWVKDQKSKKWYWYTPTGIVCSSTSGLYEAGVVADTCVAPFVLIHDLMLAGF